MMFLEKPLAKPSGFDAAVDRLLIDGCWDNCFGTRLVCQRTQSTNN